MNVAIADFTIALWKDALAQIELTRARRVVACGLGHRKETRKGRVQTGAERSPVAGRARKIPPEVQSEAFMLFRINGLTKEQSQNSKPLSPLVSI
ncbi:MAG: hypothetical protein ACLQOO_21690 [Terriglobia bacterium]